ncbi:MAG: anhydro-N-acetylmuramic acid kinase [Betaproteobacteria bacterium]|nr:anhydro-N-acetylmuramic acid kinase [Betaproteobacteria bacterium]MDH5222429.1 anhydro-N-acetylmuramic acid kinase [Betaproteobacteria bacterium]MDH5352631.1 anhydro-N-acetylmuramic acid kinase [Betaproteobacteria bacterium]
MSAELFAGLMSGTSFDGVDAVLVDFAQPRPRVAAHAYRPFEAALRAELHALQDGTTGELHRAALCANRLAGVYAQAVGALLAAASIDAATLRAIGCHGQTVRHRPEAGYTMQLGNAALLAELTGACVVADFRSRDVAAGGQGAPLAPAFHGTMLRAPGEDRAVLNLGGIANLTWLPAQGELKGFDCGPGNCLLDLWAQRHLHLPMDEDGTWAAGAAADAGLLDAMLAEPYFALPPPKSTGRDLFNESWLKAHAVSRLEPRVVQATLLELTAQSVFRALRTHCPRARRLIVCGGGVRNTALMARLRDLLAPVPVDSSAAHGIDPGLVEAAAFAWLARQTLAAQPGNLPAVTGARGPRVLGAIFPP